MVERYRDNPQPVARCIEIYLWLLREKYLPGVLAAFRGYDLAEHELAAALSFHYNTGAIGRASWVKQVKASDTVAARKSFMLYDIPESIIERRQRECDLFFRGAWSNDGTALVIPVNRANHKPIFRKAKRVSISAMVTQMLGGG